MTDAEKLEIAREALKKIQLLCLDSVRVYQIATETLTFLTAKTREEA